MPLNHVVLAGGAVVVVSVAVATVIAVYESPEFRRYADDVKRRLAMVFDSVNDGFNPPFREPRFNRPEDADGFFQSYRGRGADSGVDADDESLRRQREELLYWNAIRLEKEKEKQEERTSVDEEKQGLLSSSVTHRGSTFDDFLQPDRSGERGSFVFNSGADVNNHAHLRRRGEGARGVAPSAPCHPLPSADQPRAEPAMPTKLKAMSDIYSATTPDRAGRQTPTLERGSFTPLPAPLVDLGAPAAPAPSPQEPPAVLDRQLAEHELASASHEDPHEVYASIQAWAHESSRGFYSPLPETPLAPMSEPELVGQDASSDGFSDAGQLTPTDSLSLAGSGEDVANDARESAHFGTSGRLYDVLSESEGMETPASWSEVGSVISESEFPLPA